MCIRDRFAKFSERDVYVTAVADTYAVRLLTGPDVFELPALGGGTVSVFSANDMARGVIERGMEYSICLLYTSSSRRHRSRCWRTSSCSRTS